MPRAMTYKPNSVIYFKGDVSERIFVLKNGRVVLVSEDIETGQEIHDRVEVGEFFGVKSAFGRYPREENAQVLSQADVIVFSVPEFEQFAAANTRVIMKMLKVFSTQLRRIHTKVTNLLDQSEQVNPERGLFRIGEYYHKRKQHAQARYALGRYLEIYPTGPNAAAARNLLEEVSAHEQRYGSSPPESSGSADTSSEDSSEELTDAGKLYFKAVSQFEAGDYQGALDLFRRVAQSGSDAGEYVLKSLIEAGRCLIHLERFDEAVKHLTVLVQKYPRMSDLAEVLYYLGTAYRGKGDRERAGGFFKKVQSMAADDATLQQRVRKSLREMEVV